MTETYFGIARIQGRSRQIFSDGSPHSLRKIYAKKVKTPAESTLSILKSTPDWAVTLIKSIALGADTSTQIQEVNTLS